MKKNLAIVVGVLFSTMVFAGGIKDPVSGLAVIKKTGTTTYNLFYKNTERSDVKVSIIDAQNKIVFSEKINATDGFVRPYNFSELGEGEYTLQIEDNAGLKKEQISYSAGRVGNLLNVVRLAEANKYLVTAVGKIDQVVTVKIFNNEGEIIYIESTKLNEDFGKVYKLDKIRGAVTFEISDSAGASKVLTF